LKFKENLKTNQQLASCRAEQEPAKKTAERDSEFMQEIIVAEERKRIATDLHDDTVQKITIARLMKHLFTIVIHSKLG
jgi:signal transduction histidine kinase